MVASLNLIEETKKTEILKLYKEGLTIEELMTLTHLERLELMAVLYEAGITSLELQEICSSFDLGEESIIWISDTHLGSKLDNPRYIAEVLKFAIQHNIKNIIHTGDFFQSTINPVKSGLTDLDRQVYYGLNSYPSIDGIKTYIILGNHDYHMMVRYPEYYQVMQARKDFNILGFKKAYFRWCKQLICMQHPIDKYRIALPSMNPLLRLKGHRHEFKFSIDQTIIAPPLCDDVKQYGINCSLPGFLVLRKEGSKVKFYHYSIIDLTDKKVKTISKVPIIPKGLVYSKNLY